LRKRWAEWLTVIATSLLVPLVLYELVRRATALKTVGLTVNILIVAPPQRTPRDGLLSCPYRVRVGGGGSAASILRSDSPVAA